MMDKTYIQDQGILERYVLGELNASEQKQLEQAFITYPELKSEVLILEENFEKLALENAINPSEEVKTRLFYYISKPETKVVGLESKYPSKTFMRIAVSAAAVFLIGFIYFYSQWNTTQKQLKLVEDQNIRVNDKLDQLLKEYNETNTIYAAINNPNTKKYILEGNTLMPDAKLISYVNDTDKSVIINTAYLPELDAEHDYQMWADVEGEMINMGVIDTEKKMLAMNYIENSESLNITIEPSGGSDHPTVSKLITNIYIK